MSSFWKSISIIAGKQNFFNPDHRKIAKSRLSNPPSECPYQQKAPSVWMVLLTGKIDRNESLEIYCVKMLEQKFEKHNSTKYFVNF